MAMSSHPLVCSSTGCWEDEREWIREHCEATEGHALPAWVSEPQPPPAETNPYGDNVAMSAVDYVLDDPAPGGRPGGRPAGRAAGQPAGYYSLSPRYSWDQ